MIAETLHFISRTSSNFQFRIRLGYLSMTSLIFRRSSFLTKSALGPTRVVPHSRGELYAIQNEQLRIPNRSNIFKQASTSSQPIQPGRDSSKYPTSFNTGTFTNKGPLFTTCPTNATFRANLASFVYLWPTGPSHILCQYPSGCNEHDVRAVTAQISGY